MTLGGVSFAATGGTFLLGRTNAASTQTALTNSGAGPVLALSTKSGQVPLAVSAAAGKATNLNSDKVDGIDGSQLALALGQTGQVTGTTTLVDADGDGVNDGFLAVATCPAGTKVTGGGYTTFGYQPFESDRADNGWEVLVVATAADEPASDVAVFAECYNPRGAVPAPAAALHADRHRALTAQETKRFVSH
ncbi:MAG: hypothetical protein JWO22_2599 [Frankiales bacterium]|nr:hypothetical protein [Frankiales bacterium]